MLHLGAGKQAASAIQAAAGTIDVAAAVAGESRGEEEATAGRGSEATTDAGRGAESRVADSQGVVPMPRILTPDEIETMSKSQADRVLKTRVTNRILQIVAELQELADALDVLGCTCRRSDERPYRHASSCPVGIAWSARQAVRQMARPPYKAPSPLKDIEHLTSPFRR